MVTFADKKNKDEEEFPNQEVARTTAALGSSGISSRRRIDDDDSNHHHEKNNNATEILEDGVTEQQARRAKRPRTRKEDPPITIATGSALDEDPKLQPLRDDFAGVPVGESGAAEEEAAEKTEAVTVVAVAVDSATPTTLQQHDRQDCLVHPFENEQAESCLEHCSECRCFVCGEHAPAANCPEWRVHCRAIRESEHWMLWIQDRQKRIHDPSFRPLGAPEGLFDYHTEAQKILPNGGAKTPHMAELQHRAKRTKYYYKDKDTLLLAVELYNCSNKVCVSFVAVAASKPLQFHTRCPLSLTHPLLLLLSVSRYRERHCCGGQHLELWDATHVYECRDVVGHHTLPCDECGDNNFRKGPSGGDAVFFVDKWGSSKVCAGCMGRNVCSLYGTDPKDMARRLAALQDMQQRTKRVIKP